MLPAFMLTSPNTAYVTPRPAALVDACFQVLEGFVAAAMMRQTLPPDAPIFFAERYFGEELFHIY